MKDMSTEMRFGIYRYHESIFPFVWSYRVSKLAASCSGANHPRLTPRLSRQPERSEDRRDQYFSSGYDIGQDLFRKQNQKFSEDEFLVQN